MSTRGALDDRVEEKQRLMDSDGAPAPQISSIHGECDNAGHLAFLRDVAYITGC
jgi:hypothetical protein